MKCKIIYLFSFLLCFEGFSQDTTSQSVFNPNVAEIMTLVPDLETTKKVTISNLNDIKIDEAPGSVVVITSDDIEKSGYKDLSEIFMNITGFNLATDVQNGVGLSLRGFWTSEAKILFMIDGMTMNDMAYGSFVLGGRIPLLNIDRIEIIKGASSSIYGGIAGLGVVNIVTKSGKTSKGSAFVVDYGVSNNKTARTRLAFANTSYLLNDFEVSVCGSVFTGNRSNQIYTQKDSTITDFNDSSLLAEAFVELKLKRKNFEYKILYEDYNFQAAHERISSLTRTFINEANFNKKFKKMQFSGTYNMTDQIPWNTQYGDPSIYDSQNLKTRRFRLDAHIKYDFTEKLNILVGGLYNNDLMKFYRPAQLLNNGQRSESFHAFAGYTEISYFSKYINVFLGGRYDSYQTIQPNFSPRLSFTKEFKYFHYKLIYGQSLKIPTLQNINLAYNSIIPLKPEKIIDYQAEIGIKNKSTKINLNLFKTQINDIILFNYDLNTFTESYINKGQINIWGYELYLNTKISKLDINVGYSAYHLLNSNATDYIADTANSKLGTLGIPTIKINSNIRYSFNNKFALVLNYIYQNDKYTYEQINKISQEYSRVRYPSTHLLDLTFQSKAIVKFCDFNIGVHNILNTNNFIVYPISSGYSPSIGMGREFYAQLKINL